MLGLSCCPDPLLPYLAANVVIPAQFKGTRIPEKLTWKHKALILLHVDFYMLL